jgi:hypothetical protein
MGEFDSEIDNSKIFLSQTSSMKKNTRARWEYSKGDYGYVGSTGTITINH